MAAPVCHINQNEVIEQPDPKTLPSVPIANDLASALVAINALRQIVNSITNQQNQGGISGFKVKPQDRGKGYSEVHRVMQTVRVFNPQDKTQFVDVQQLKQLVMRDGTTGELWVYNL